jgi:hypothetical protein
MVAGNFEVDGKGGDTFITFSHQVFAGFQWELEKDPRPTTDVSRKNVRCHRCKILKMQDATARSFGQIGISN